LTPKWTWAQLAVITFLQARLNVSLPGLRLDLLASNEFFDLAHKTLALARRRFRRREAMAEKAAKYPAIPFSLVRLGA
jgi:hypothetical protein